MQMRKKSLKAVQVFTWGKISVHIGHKQNQFSHNYAEDRSQLSKAWDGSRVTIEANFSQNDLRVDCGVAETFQTSTKDGTPHLPTGISSLAS